MTTNIMNEITLIGGILALCTGLNILKITKIKVLNLMPVLLIPIILLKALIRYQNITICPGEIYNV
jgi:hypothetical protein